MNAKTSMKLGSDIYALGVESHKRYSVSYTPGESVFAEPEARERSGGPKPLSAADRVRLFWSRVKRPSPDACWEWQGARFLNGYGMVAAGRREGRALTRTTHRVAYQLTHGPITDDRHILHTCDNRICCNPAHMRLGTHVENITDAVEKGRMGGPLNAQQQVTPEMIEACLSGPRGTALRLAREHGIAPLTMLQAVYLARKRRKAGA